MEFSLVCAAQGMGALYVVARQPHAFKGRAETHARVVVCGAKAAIE